MKNDRPPPRIAEPSLRTLSFIHRWNILRRIRNENVAEHSFYVTVYAGQIAAALKWKGDYRELYEHCLAHDVDEEITGDISGPTKIACVDSNLHRAFVDREAMKRYGDSFIRDYVMYPGVVSDEVKKIRHAADRLDWCMYLATELSMGNISVDEVFRNNAVPSAHKAWMNLPEEGSVLNTLWHTEIFPAIEAVADGCTRSFPETR